MKHLALLAVKLKMLSPIRRTVEQDLFGVPAADVVDSGLNRVLYHFKN